MSNAQILKTIERFDRLNCSVNGNPRYRVTFTDGAVLDSMSDASWCYAVGNPGMRVGSTVAIETRAGRIRHMTNIPASS
jgi:hypothetical protein